MTSLNCGINDRKKENGQRGSLQLKVHPPPSLLASLDFSGVHCRPSKH